MSDNEADSRSSEKKCTNRFFLVLETEVSIGKLNFIVGKIVNVEKHPESDVLYVEKIDVGEEEPRTILSGLAQYKTLEEMKDKTVVVLLNLKPRKLRNIMSCGMIMCTTNTDKTEIDFLIPPEGSKPGDVIFFENHPREPDAVLNPKKKIFETLAVDFNVKEDLIVRWKNEPFRTKNGLVTAMPGHANGLVS